MLLIELAAVIFVVDVSSFSITTGGIDGDKTRVSQWYTHVSVILMGGGQCSLYCVWSIIISL